MGHRLVIIVQNLELKLKVYTVDSLFPRSPSDLTKTRLVKPSIIHFSNRTSSFLVVVTLVVTVFS
jgi:hypothetical protein